MLPTALWWRVGSAVEVGDAAVPALQKKMTEWRANTIARHHRHRIDDGVDDLKPGSYPCRSVGRRQ